MVAEPLHDAPPTCLTVLLEVLKHILRTGDVPHMPHNWRRTCIQMPPRVARAKVPADFRPIVSFRCGLGRSSGPRKRGQLRKCWNINFFHGPFYNLSSAVPAQGPYPRHTEFQGLQHSPDPGHTIPKRAACLARLARAEAAGHGGVEEAILVEKVAELRRWRRWRINVCGASQRETKQRRGERLGGSDGKEGCPSLDTWANHRSKQTAEGNVEFVKILFETFALCCRIANNRTHHSIKEPQTCCNETGSLQTKLDMKSNISCMGLLRRQHTFQPLVSLIW